ncbi:hypothetical protein MA16_Dca002734 [Dendrobium catenatum]|uniref:Uncharacterized protein n=1 Tax=Dendrobium catenatum TaxID=906689 RepID=A0A2I0X8J9_9ASPA|nr:hypothetical protein MA16_Dca002734 [Dendrobium catenatum]
MGKWRGRCVQRAVTCEEGKMKTRISPSGRRLEASARGREGFGLLCSLNWRKTRGEGVHAATTNQKEIERKSLFWLESAAIDIHQQE